MNFKKRVNGSWSDIPHYIHNTATDTLTTLPADLYADGNNATVGLVGNMVQTGTPTPSSPIYPTECGDKTANLCDIASFTIAANDDSKNEVIYNGELDAGTYTVSLNQDNAITGSIRNTFRVTIDGTTTYENASNNYHNNAGQHRFTFTVPTKQTVDVRYWANTLNNACTYSQIMLNTGSTALPYEPYGYKIPISSASTTTPVYLGEVQSTRWIMKLVLMGEEEWGNVNPSPTSRYFRMIIGNMDSVITNMVISTHYTQTSINSSNTDNGVNVVNSSSVNKAILSIRPYNVEDIDLLGWKNYLRQQYAAGTPVTVWYVLATPTTGIVNEPIRKIGDYADTVSGITIPTIAGKDTFDVQTTLKPSEVSVNYHGWHPVADVHERENGAWD